MVFAVREMQWCIQGFHVG